MPRFAVPGVLMLALLAAGSAWAGAAPRIGEAAGDCTLTASQEALDIEERAFLTLINNYRVANGRAALTASYKLTRAAQWKSIDMAVNDYVAHDDLTRTWGQRINDCGYTFGTWLGENIAVSGETGQWAFGIWQGSPGHNANMLSTNYTAIGIGRHYLPGSDWGWYWTTDFGGVNDGWAFATEAPGGPTAPTVGERKDGVTLNVGERAGQWTLRAEPAHPAAAVRVEFYVDGRLIGADQRAPYAARWREHRRGGTHTFTARAIGRDGVLHERSLASTAGVSRRG